MCGEWNSLVEEMATRTSSATASSRRAGGQKSMGEGGSVAPTPRLRDIKSSAGRRLNTGIKEFDFVLGGGMVPGSMVLVGGEPGIGKSTLLLQVAGRLQELGHSTLYVSGEESALQVKLRAERLHGSAEDVALLNETLLETIIATAGAQRFDAIVVDSIQTVFTSDLEGAPGNVGQVRECAARLMRFAKETETTVFAVGHVTKGGGIAGPKTLEHIVDTVLYFEGDKGHSSRILRAVKNRFGSTNEIGVFEMKDSGLEEVSNPSELFLAERPQRTAGSVVVSSLEGSRPILVELQALVSATSYAMPKRMANGVELNRVSLLLAVMEKRLGLHLSGQDVYVNVVGGMHIDEPAIDLGIVAAVTSSLREVPVEPGLLVLGEVGLGGEVRAISQAELRIREAAKMGFKRCLLPERNLAKLEAIDGIELVGIREVGE